MASFIEALTPAVALATFNKRSVLGHLYGPDAKALRAQVCSLIYGEKVNKSDKRVQWGNFRAKLIEMSGVQGNCIAAQDNAFEEFARRMFAT